MLWGPEYPAGHAERSRGISLASLHRLDYLGTRDASAALGMTAFFDLISSFSGYFWS